MTEPYYDNPDIGMCDDCGTEDGTRRPTIVDGCVAWLCGPCKRGFDDPSVPPRGRDPLTGALTDRYDRR